MEAPEAENPEARPPVPPWGFPEWFVISQTAFPALLLVPGSQSVRLPLRAASFAVSLLGLVWRRPGGWGRPVGHPSQPFLAAVLIYLVFMLFHPTTNSLTAGCVQILLYLAVLAPAFWAPRLVRGPEHLARLLFLFLVCNGINAAMGVLQVYAPGVWMPKELSTVITTSEYGLDAVSYLGPDGTRIVRPPGLFDNPGAVCGPGMTAGVLGLIFCLAPASLGKKGLGLGLALAGMAVIYLSQVRTSLLLVGGMAVVFPVVLVVLQGEWRKAAWFVGLMGLLLTAAFSLAVALGGPSIRERFTTLVDKNPVELFYASRGQQLEAGLKSLLVEYPLGAGLGRWGIIQTYF
ncbi:MAG: hypothetical protein JO112_23830, partial [Planctomycetes bacterium]|nr:hypothetical protein [Planctomycetota bacterium]